MKDSEQEVSGARPKLVSLLRREIAEGALKPGGKLNEKVICERFGVSRTMVRETFRQLEAEGLILIEPHRGAIVSRVSYARAVSLFELRTALESLACELCATKATEKQKRQLWWTVENVEVAMQTGDVHEMIAAKDLYYEALLNGACNPELSDALTRLHTRISQIRRVSLGTQGRSEHSLQEIRAIAEAIIAGDGVSAAKAGRDHVLRARAATLPKLFTTDD